ncbi:hypothetical protein C8A01DRAFT_35949 [Parachaetomium inaequale]|uniref:MADS-box domain-containing protein n=1 Tax=Parachaetomium inaequale TaxID=2588326 RepID=A0AAN6PFQ6_9PEZI|nr:hypothetical protein C8A01DRAFT_35949 [Parachaetomium inaequale]
MGRRKIDIKPIKDERNRSVTFLKRKGGLFKKAYELSVLCSVDVAVVIFGNNKKLHQFSSRDMREMLQRWTLHGEPNEYKIPSDFNGGADDDDDEDDNGTPPQGEGMEPQMFPPHFQTQPQFPVIRHHTASASPPIPNGVFGQQRGHTPQPQMGSRPSSRNDIRRIGPNMVGQPVGPPGSQQGPVNGYAFMPQSAMYNGQNPHNMPPNLPHGLPQPHPQYPYPQQQPHPHQLQPFVDEQRRASGPAAFPHQPPQGAQQGRHSVSPPQPPAPQLPPQPIPHMSPPPQPQAPPIQSPPQPQQHLPPPPPPPPQPQEIPHIFVPPQESQSSAPAEPRPRPELVERARQPLLLDTNIKKQAPRKGGSIFTPIDENRSILSQHLAAFHHPEVKSEAPSSRSQSTDAGSISRDSNTNSPPTLSRLNTQLQPQIKRNGSLGTIPETVFTPPSRSNSLRVGGSVPRPQLKVRIPDESDGGSATEASSPRGTMTTATDVTSQPSRRPTESHSSGVVLPPPSPSASTTMHSAGATGPPNPFARPPPHQSMDTPVSALPSRFLGENLLPSPNGFYADWGIKGNENNTLSPLTWSTPVVGTGPSFLRDDLAPLKRKSPDISGNGSHHEPSETMGADAKRVKVDH